MTRVYPGGSEDPSFFVFIRPNVPFPAIYVAREKLQLAGRMDAICFM